MSSLFLFADVLRTLLSPAIADSKSLTGAKPTPIKSNGKLLVEAGLGSSGALLKFVMIYQSRTKITASDCASTGAGTVCLCVLHRVEDICRHFRNNE